MNHNQKNVLLLNDRHKLADMKESLLHQPSSTSTSSHTSSPSHLSPFSATNDIENLFKMVREKRLELFEQLRQYVNALTELWFKSSESFLARQVGGYSQSKDPKKIEEANLDAITLNTGWKNYYGLLLSGNLSEIVRTISQSSLLLPNHVVIDIKKSLEQQVVQLDSATAITSSGQQVVLIGAKGEEYNDYGYYKREMNLVRLALEQILQGLVDLSKVQQYVINVLAMPKSQGVVQLTTNAAEDLFNHATTEWLSNHAVADWLHDYLKIKDWLNVFIGSINQIFPETKTSDSNDKLISCKQKTARSLQTITQLVAKKQLLSDETIEIIKKLLDEEEERLDKILKKAIKKSDRILLTRIIRHLSTGLDRLNQSQHIIFDMMSTPRINNGLVVTDPVIAGQLIMQLNESVSMLKNAFANRRTDTLGKIEKFNLLPLYIERYPKIEESLDELISFIPQLVERLEPDYTMKYRESRSKIADGLRHMVIRLRHESKVRSYYQPEEVEISSFANTFILQLKNIRDEKTKKDKEFIDTIDRITKRFTLMIQLLQDAISDGKYLSKPKRFSSLEERLVMIDALYDTKPLNKQKYLLNNIGRLFYHRGKLSWSVTLSLGSAILTTGYYCYDQYQRGNDTNTKTLANADGVIFYLMLGSWLALLVALARNYRKEWRHPKIESATIVNQGFFHFASSRREDGFKRLNSVSTDIVRERSSSVAPSLSDRVASPADASLGRQEHLPNTHHPIEERMASSQPTLHTRLLSGQQPTSDATSKVFTFR